MPYPKVPRQISNPISENIQKLASLFPSAVKDGELDIEALKQELGEFTEVGPEKYELTWAGKQKAKQTAFEPIIGKTLKYVPEDSKHPDTTENLFIEGDNLEVLKLLRQNYYGAVKMIYIDPPYNTGNDFIYNDNFRMSKEESDIAEGDVSDIGERYTKNRKDHNRYHTHWLNMISSRLRIARDLLREDGVIFISIDDNEIASLRKICDEIFGEDNFVTTNIWEKADSPRNSARQFSEDHDYVVIYSKISTWAPFKLERTKDSNSIYSNPDNDPRGKWIAGDPFANKPYSRGLYEISGPTGRKFSPPSGRYWRISEDKLWELDSQGRIWWGPKGNARPSIKRYLSEVGNLVPRTLWRKEDVGSNRTSKNEMRKLFPETQSFDTPKPTALINRILNVSTQKDQGDIILDFFAGSATTAHSIIALNAIDNGNRKYIMVQISENCDEKSEFYKSGYKNICEIGKERIRRAGEKILEENKDKKGIENLDTGFKVFRVADTNINWLREDLRGGDLFDHYDKNASDKDKLDFTPGFTDLDVVYEIMLRQTDIPLSSRVEQLTAMGQRTYLFADSFLVCLETSITRELVERLAAIEPLPIKFIFRDSAFDDDIALKDETFRTLSALTDRNNGGEKHTYTVEFI